MTMRWSAARVAVEEELDLDVLSVVLAEHPDGSGRRLMFQVGASVVDEPDFDEVYCLVTETHACTYGGIRSLALGGLTLRLVLSPAAAEELGWSDRRLLVALAVEPDEVQALRDGLARVFASTIESSRPWRLSLPRATPEVRSRRLFRRPLWGPGARGRRVTFRVAAVRGTVLEVVAEPSGLVDDMVPIRFVGDLMKMFGVAVAVGQRFSYRVKPDRWGTTFSDPRLEKPARQVGVRT